MIKRSQNGFTLVELLITCALIGIIGIAMAAFLTNWLQDYSETNAQTALLDNAENALDTVTQDIRLSGAADTNNRWPDANSPSGDYGWASGANTLVLAKAAIDKNGNIIFSDPNHYITEKDNEVYFIQDQKLYRRTIASDNSNDTATTTCPAASASSTCPADKVVATGVDNFSVKYYDADENEVAPSSARSVQLALKLEDKVGSKMITASYSTRMVFRNN